jgi:DNA-binding GntR family transcriptional regulator
VTVGTVTRAYGEAERRGLIQGEVGRGTYVRGPRPAETHLVLARPTWSWPRRPGPPAPST